MSLNRRDFIKASAITGGAGLLTGLSGCEPKAEAKKASPLDGLVSVTKDIVPISIDERKARIEHAQSLMTAMKMDAIFLDGGTSMEYFTGLKWGNSERMMAAIIPRKGEVKYVGPHFEEERIP